MPRLFLLYALADLAIMVIALIDCLSVDEHAIRALPRLVWVVLILLFSPVGGIVWFVAGRPERQPAGRGSWRPGNGFPEAERPERPAGPDDDTDFLAGIAETGPTQPAGGDGTTDTAAEDLRLLRAWEADLRRREEQLRAQQANPGAAPAAPAASDAATDEFPSTGERRKGTGEPRKGTREPRKATGDGAPPAG